MKRSVWLWELVGFAFTSLGGTLLHFLYGWLKDAAWIAPISAVNESTWEHMKLLFWPMLIFAVIQSFFFKERSDFWFIKLRGILTGLILIPVLFYTYNGIIGSSPDWINIAIFFICAAVAYVYEFILFERKAVAYKSPALAIIALAAIAVLFIVFTFITPEIAIFKDPVGGGYGI